MADPTPSNNEDTSSSRNPFSRRTDFSPQSLLTYKLTTSITYLALLVTSIYYAIHHPTPQHGRFTHYNPPTPFAQSAIITSIYWLILFALQLAYLYAFYTPSAIPAANLGAHYVASNLLLFGFVHLWVRGLHILGLVLLVINFANLTTAYFRHSATPRVMHIGVLSGPLAWNFVGLYWAGAVCVGSNHWAARVAANVCVWGWVAYGAFYLVAFKDYSVGYALSVLAFSTAVGQFLTKPHLFQLQWIFAFAIGGLLFVVSTAVGLPGLLGRDPFPRGQIVSEERERAPLLADD